MARSELALLLVLSLVAPVRADEPKKEEPAKKAEPAKKDEPKKDEPKKDEPKKDKKKDGLPTPPAELAKILETFDKEDETAREVKRVYASSLYYLLARDLEKFVACFHPDFALHEGNSGIRKMPLAELKATVKKGWESQPKSALTLAQLVDLSKAKAYSKADAKAKGADGWKKEPRAISAVMEDDDWLVIAPTTTEGRNDKSGAFESEVFYILRKHDGAYKIVLGE